VHVLVLQENFYFVILHGINNVKVKQSTELCSGAREWKPPLGRPVSKRQDLMKC